jgi:hypothetical protein
MIAQEPDLFVPNDTTSEFVDDDGAGKVCRATTDG